MIKTESTINGHGLTLKTVLDTTQELKKLPVLDQWIVIDPHGWMYQGKVEQVLKILMARHPLVNKSLTLNPSFD